MPQRETRCFLREQLPEIGGAGRVGSVCTFRSCAGRGVQPLQIWGRPQPPTSLRSVKRPGDTAGCCCGRAGVDEARGKGSITQSINVPTLTLTSTA